MTAADTRMTVRNLPWYGASTELVDVPQNADAALTAAGLSWEVELRPLYFRVRENGKDKTVRSSKSATVRKDTHDELGIVGSRYTVFQNREAFAFLDKLVEDGGAKYQAGGTMGGGSKVFVVMQTPSTIKVLGEDHDTYVLFTTSHDGSSTVTATTTLVRPACTNMFRSMLSSDRPVFRQAHVGSMLDPETMAEVARESLGVATADQRRFAELAEQLASAPIDHSHSAEFDGIMARAFPWATKAAQKEVAAIHDLWMTSETIDNEWRFTGWGLMNATTEYLGHFRSRRSSEAGLKRALGVNGQVEARLVKAILAQ